MRFQLYHIFVIEDKLTRRYRSLFYVLICDGVPFDFTIMSLFSASEIVGFDRINVGKI